MRHNLRDGGAPTTRGDTGSDNRNSDKGLTKLRLVNPNTATAITDLMAPVASEPAAPATEIEAVTGRFGALVRIFHDVEAKSEIWLTRCVDIAALADR